MSNDYDKTRVCEECGSAEKVKWRDDGDWSVDSDTGYYCDDCWEGIIGK